MHCLICMHRSQSCTQAYLLLGAHGNGKRRKSLAANIKLERNIITSN